jgi:photosystem I subunit 8
MFYDKNMAAAFLPSILVPIVGLVFPAISMALFFIYISIDDIELILDFLRF